MLVVLCTSLGTSISANSSTAFKWLLGYEGCRTGWDRFTKPHPMSSDPNSLVTFDPGSGFPESWPWSHIITPNLDGSTEIASKCVCPSRPHIAVPISLCVCPSRPYIAVPIVCVSAPLDLI